METFNEIQQLVADMEADVTKTSNGNAAAGRRVRKAAMQLKKLAHTLRSDVLDEIR